MMEEIDFTDPDPVSAAFGTFAGNPPKSSAHSDPTLDVSASTSYEPGNQDPLRLPRTGGTLGNRGAFLRDTIQSQLPTNEQLQKRKQQAGRVLKSFGNTLNKINLGKLIDQMEQDQGLADSLEQLNSRMKEEVERQEVRREAEQLSLKVITDHLEGFLKDSPMGTYEDWISDLHPENANQGQLLNDIQQIDERFYVMESDHRKLWNRAIEKQYKEKRGDDGLGKETYSYRLVQPRTQIWGSVGHQHSQFSVRKGTFSDTPTLTSTTNDKPVVDLLTGSVEFNPIYTNDAVISKADDGAEAIDIFAPTSTPVVTTAGNTGNTVSEKPDRRKQSDPFQDLIKF